MQSEVFEYLLNKGDAKIIVCEDDKEALAIENVVNDSGVKAFKLPDFRANFGDDLRSFKSELFELSSVLCDFYEFEGEKIIISPFCTILNKLPSKKHLKKIYLNFGDKVDLNELKEELLHIGYEPVDIVESEGEFCFRGDILDVFCVGAQEPYRILLFNDEIESIRSYSTQTQISNKNELEAVRIVPFVAVRSLKRRAIKLAICKATLLSAI